MQQENANRWSHSWTRYHNHVKDNCIALSSRCQTYKIEDLIIEPDIVLRDIYDSLSIKTAPSAKRKIFGRISIINVAFSVVCIRSNI